MRSPMLNIFIGYDASEAVAYHVAAASILRRATIPVAIVPLTRQSVGRTYTRERGPTEATEFSLTRFLVPHLSNYTDVSIFMDCDMVVRVDILDLWLDILAQPDKAVWCCQHDYIPRSEMKFDRHTQTTYPRKNWTSFMVFDNAKCRALTPEYVNHASGLQLHRLQWVPDELIGSLPLEWNYLVGEDNQADVEPKVMHYTNGGPWHGEEYANGPDADVWRDELALLLGSCRPTAVAR